MSASARLGLPLLSAGQAQKELVHNEALQAIEILVAAAVEEPPRAVPPAAPAVGATYIVAAAPNGDWTGKADSLACFTGGGWRFSAAQDGMTAYVRNTSLWAVFRGGAWEFGSVRGSSLVLGGEQVVGPRLAAIADPSGGTTVDGEGRAAITQILAALRQHGLIEA
jgi:hypothetical protein